MNQERWRQVEELYHEAQARPSAERGAFLQSACGADHELRDQVLSLLANESGDGFFEHGMTPLFSSASPLENGQRLGVYEIRGLLGKGGMGEVHRAYDTRLAREVAIKVLPAAFIDNPSRLARFEREARVLASLNHPNIGAIYGLEDTTKSGASIRALILELVDGETLADRIARGRLRLAEAMKIALQVASALETTHEKGIVHRDLKPANIKITAQGTVKVLDFGLAALSGGPPALGLTGAPTASIRTEPGMLLGTVPYMSPEQARGESVDKRTDVWAFGCVLYEMLTGKRAFSGATMSDVIAAILERDPDWTRLPVTTPDHVRRVLRWALAKDPQRRLRDLADARLELETPDPTRLDVERRRRPQWTTAVWMTIAIASAIAGAMASRSLRPLPPDSMRFTSNFAIPVGSLEALPRQVAISPDGRYVAYLAGPPGNQKTYLRGLADRTSRAISELPMQAPQPFFSPDSEWVAFFDAGKLKKLALAGGSAITLAEAPTPRGGTWGSDGSIVFAPISRGGLMWLPGTGGPPQTLTTPDEARGETSHRTPGFLPGSRIVLFVADSSSTSGRSLQAVSLDTKQVTVLKTGDAFVPRYIPTGHLAYLTDGKLMAAPFEASTLRVTASPITLLQDIDSYSFSDEGTLVYSDAPAYNIRTSTLVWSDRNGSVTPLPLPPAVYDHPRLSPDGRTIVVHKEAADDRNLWLYNRVRETSTKFTLTGSNNWPVWSAGGKRILYASNRPGTQYDIVSKPVDGSGPEQAVLERPLTQIPRAVTASGDTLIFEETYANQPNTLWRMSLDQRSEPRPLFDSAAGEMMPSYSPDGRWIAYVSPQSARNEVFVRSSTGQGSRWPISDNGGVEPVWSFNGREIFYRADDKMMVVDVELSPAPSFGKPRVLFEGSYVFGATEGQAFDVTHDGNRFLMLKPQRLPTPTPLNVIVNWFDELRRRVPAAP